MPRAAGRNAAPGLASRASAAREPSAAAQRMLPHPNSSYRFPVAHEIL